MIDPTENGEVYVTDDGAETDLDLGHYERFLGSDLRRDSNVTTGSVYQSVIRKERRGDYLGATVQVIPHITNEIRNMIKTVAERSGADIAVVELGPIIRGATRRAEYIWPDNIE